MTDSYPSYNTGPAYNPVTGQLWQSAQPQQAAPTYQAPQGYSQPQWDQYVRQAQGYGATNQAQMQGVADWMDYANETGARGLFHSYKFPANQGMHDFANYLSYAEKFGNNAGWKYLPRPDQLQQAMNQGLTYAEAARQWGGALPADKGWVRQGMSADQFDQWKNQNRERVQARYGPTANLTDTLYSQDMENPVNPGPTKGRGIGGYKAGQAATSYGGYGTMQPTDIDQTQSSVR